VVPAGFGSHDAAMSELELEAFETQVELRPMTLDDFEELVALQLKCFPGMEPWTRGHIESQQAHFPEGQLLVTVDDRIVASSSSLIVDTDHYEDWQDWKEISDNGYIRNHDEDGDALYGIEIMVDPQMRGLKLARRLYDARKALVRERNLRSIIIGGRIPGYGKYADEMSAREYVEKVMDKKLFDPVLTAQLANGFVLRRLIPNYLPSDSESRGYATFCAWENLDYERPQARRFQAVSNTRLCLVQYMMRPIDYFENFRAQVEYFVDSASDYKSDFVVFPELMTTQLLATFRGDRPAEAVRKLASYTPKYLETMRDLAVRYDVNIVGGSQFTVEDGDLYNVAYLFRRDGTIDKQYKIHPTPSERKWWGVVGGDQVRALRTDRGKVALLIGYDIQFPELARVARERGAQMIFCPYAADERHSFLAIRNCAQARAIENHQYVAIVGSTGTLPFVDNADVHYAQSGIYTPSDFAFARDGIAAESSPNTEDVLFQDIDTALLRRSVATGSARTWLDRRTELYRIESDL
jgi:predicted amidohydrolase/ribosomal protein S18 acetylase RimI-like enzyme